MRVVASAASIVAGCIVVGGSRRVAQPLLRGLHTGIGVPLQRADEHGECVYLDYQATTPVWPEVAEAAIPYLKLHWGNPSSGHAFARPCAAAVETARAQVAALVGAVPEEILFTSCGSEADNHAILAAVEAEEERRRAIGAPVDMARPHVVTSNIEHPAITECLEALKACGRVETTYVQVDGECLLEPQKVAAAVRAETVLVTVMLANNEVGSILPVAQISRACRAVKPTVLIHTDAAQAIGKMDVSAEALDVDMLTLVGHKFGAPKGVAALYIAKGSLGSLTGRLPKLIHGGGQEGGRRAGTECVVLDVALGKAAEIAKQEIPALSEHMRVMRNTLYDLLVQGLGRDTVRINGPADDALRLPNTLSIGIKGVQSALLLARLSEEVAASAGAACHTDAGGVSAVLSAMSVPQDFAVGTLRLSTGRHTTMAEVKRGAQLIIEEAKRQRSSSV